MGPKFQEGLTPNMSFNYVLSSITFHDMLDTAAVFNFQTHALNTLALEGALTMLAHICAEHSKAQLAAAGSGSSMRERLSLVLWRQACGGQGTTVKGRSHTEVRSNPEAAEQLVTLNWRTIPPKVVLEIWSRQRRWDFNDSLF